MEDRWKKLWENLKPQISDLAQKAGEVAKRAGDTISDMAKTLGKESAKLAKIGKLKAEIVSLELNRNDIFRKIGERLYDLYKKGENIEKDKFDDLLKEIEKIESTIIEKQKEIKKIAEEEKLEPEDVEKIPTLEDEEKKD
jgi:gas vesicle protein